MLKAIRFFLRLFIKITGFLPAIIFLKTKVYYSSLLAKKENKHIKGGAIIISNHTSQFDYYTLLFHFLFRVVHTFVGEIVYKFKGLHFLNYVMENIRCFRNEYSEEPINQGLSYLKKNKLVLIFPEGGYETIKGKIQSFKRGVIYLALRSGKPIIPIYQKGSYSLFKRNRILIGERIYLKDYLSNDEPDEKEIDRLAGMLQSKIKQLQNQEKDFELTHSGKLINFHFFFIDFLKAISTPFFQLIYFTKFVKVGNKKIIKRNMKGKAVIISNHVSYIDPLVIFMQHLFRRERIIMGKDMLDILNPFLKNSALLARVIPLARDGQADIAGLKLVNATLNANGVVVLFPEGHINFDNNLSSFMPGCALFAYLNNAPIYPRIFVNAPKPFHKNIVILGEPICLSEYMDISSPINETKLNEANDIIFNKMKDLYNIAKAMRK